MTTNVQRWTEGTQHTQFTNNVKLRHVRTTMVAVERQWILHIVRVCVCSLKYPACNAHAPYCHLWPTRLYKIFPHYLINGTIFEKKILTARCVFRVSLQSLSTTVFILRSTERDMIENICVCVCLCVCLYIYIYIYILSWPASWSSGQSFWLLIMRSRVRFPVLPWGFFSLKGKIPLATTVWVVTRL
jgi:hypothetical protein